MPGFSEGLSVTVGVTPSDPGETLTVIPSPEYSVKSVKASGISFTTVTPPFQTYAFGFTVIVQLMVVIVPLVLEISPSMVRKLSTGVSVRVLIHNAPDARRFSTVSNSLTLQRLYG